MTGQTVKQTEYPKETAILERVIDGDTIVYRIGNISQHCRLLGRIKPEKGDFQINFNTPIYYNLNEKEF